MGAKIVVIGSGAIGGYVGARMAEAGEDVTLVDSWPAHVEKIRAYGMRLSGIAATDAASIPVRALHVCDVQMLSRERPVDVAFIATKSYDTEWAAQLIKGYLAPDGFVVSMQNGINEERIAGIVGWGKTMGVVLTVLGAELSEAGHITRTAPLGGTEHVDFRVGEVHGRDTPRAREVARILTAADSSRVTDNLWGEHWSKLCVNAMRNGLSAVTGFGGLERESNEGTRWLGIRLGSEAVRVGQALGYRLETIATIEPETLARAGEGDRTAFDSVAGVFYRDATTRSDGQRPSMGQDIRKGRRTETDDINGYVAAKGREIGVPAPLNEKMNELVKRVERGEIEPGIGTVREMIHEAPQTLRS